MADRYLLVQLADIGDLVLTTPAIAALREAHPDAHLTLLTTTHSAPVMPPHLVNEIITFERQNFNSSSAFFKPANLRRLWSLRSAGRYDAIIFFHHFTLKLGTLKFALTAFASGANRRIGLQNGNGWFLTESIPDEGFGLKHQAQYWLDLVGLLGADTAPQPAQVNAAASEGSEALAFVNIAQQRRTIFIHPGSGGYSLARRWDAEKFAAVADQLHEALGAQIVLIGTANDDTASVKTAMRHEPLDLTGKTNLNTLASLLSHADLYIGADSGVMHIAAAAGTPTLAIFGPSNHQAWGPWTPSSKSLVVRSAPECSPCSYVGHTIGLREGCPARTCMRMVTVEQVVATAKALLKDVETPSTNPTTPTAKSDAQQHRRISILGLPVDAITYDQWLALIGSWITVKQQQLFLPARHVCTTNPEFMMMAQRDVNFRNILQRADLCVPDGIGIVLAARWLGQPLPGRVTGSDGVPKIAERAAQEGWKLFFLGAAPGVADKAADVLRARYPNLQIVGSYSGSPAPEEEDMLVEMVNASGADILFVAYGAPEQDKWIARNLPRLKVAMAMGVGGTFDFIAGVVPRAPEWMQRLGLEWLFRLILQPWRIKRMTRLPRFALAVIFSKK